MSENISQWLAEIQSLQQQIADLKKEREQAYASVDNWRNAYDAEAQQRRRDTEMYRAKIGRLEQPLVELRSSTQIEGDTSKVDLTGVQGEQSGKQLRDQLVVAWRECDRLKTKLQTEEAEHLNTRESLTAALGDAVDLLSKERS